MAGSRSPATEAPVENDEKVANRSHMPNPLDKAPNHAVGALELSSLHSPECGQPCLATALQSRHAGQPKPQNGGHPSPRPQQWEHHRATIKRLYLDEDMTLNEVIEHMKMHYNIYATRRMYKKRLTQWHLDIKNVKRTDAIAAIQTRSFEDPDRDFVVINNRAISTQRLKRSLTHRWKATQRTRNQHHDALPPPSRTLEAPGNLHTQHYLAHTLAGYVDGSFETRKWTIGNGWENLRTIKSWPRTTSQLLSLCYTFEEGISVLDMAAQDSLEAGFRKLNAAFALLDNALVDEDSVLMLGILQPLVRCWYSGKHDLGAMFLRQIYSMGITRLGTSHPIVCISAALLNVPCDSLLSSYELLVRVFSAGCGQHLKAQNSETYACVAQGVDFCLRVASSVHEALQMSQSFLRTIQLQQIPLDILLATWRDGWTLFSQGRYKEALDKLEPVRMLLDGLPEAWLGPWYLYMLGTCEARLGSSNVAKAYLSQAISLSELLWDPMNPQTVKAIRAYLEAFPDDEDIRRRWEQIEEARRKYAGS